MAEQRINNVIISCLEILDNSEQNKGGKYLSILCSSREGDVFAEGGPAVLYPSGQEITVRSVEKDTSGNYITVLKGVHRKDLKRGNLIIPLSHAVYIDKEAFFLIPSSKERFEKGSYFIEGGIFPDFNRRNSKPSVSFTFHGRIASARFFYPFILIPGGRYYISSEDNRDLRTPVTLIFPGSLGSGESQQLSERILKFGGRPSLKAVYSVILRLKKSVNLPDYMKDEEFEGSVRAGSWAVMSRDYERIRSSLLKRAASFGGFVEKDLVPAVGGDRETVQQILSQLIRDGLLSRKDGYIINSERDASASLSPIASKLLADLEGLEEGLKLETVNNPLFAETYRALARMELAALLNGEILISLNHFSRLRKEVLSGMEIGDVFDLSLVRNSIPAGRRLLIPLLEEMDRQGYFEWNEEKRVVLRKD